MSKQSRRLKDRPVPVPGPPTEPRRAAVPMGAIDQWGVTPIGTLTPGNIDELVNLNAFKDVYINRLRAEIERLRKLVVADALAAREPIGMTPEAEAIAIEHDLDESAPPSESEVA